MRRQLLWATIVIATLFVYNQFSVSQNAFGPLGGTNIWTGPNSYTTLTAGNCLQAGTGGLLTTTPNPCSTGTLSGITTATGSGLTGGGLTGTLALSLLQSCSTNQVLVWNGSAWLCANQSGGGGGGNLTTTPGPGTSQNILQQLNTQFSANTISNITYVEPSAYNWIQSPGGSLTGGVQATVTLTPCPQGIHSNDSNLYVHIVGTGGGDTPEDVQANGTGSGCGTSGGSSGTIVFTPVHSHTGYTLQSSSQGIYEGIMSKANSTLRIQDAHIVLKPAGDYQSLTTYAYTITAPIVVNAINTTLDGSGALFLCATRSWCMTDGTASETLVIQGIDFVSTVPLSATIGWAITNTACSANTVTITAPGHGVKVGDFIDIQYTDDKSYWGGNILLGSGSAVSAVTTNTISYPWTNCGTVTSIPSEPTPGYVDIANAGIFTNSTGPTLEDIRFLSPDINGTFANGIIVGNNEALHINRLTASPASTGGPEVCQGTYCGQIVYAPGATNFNLDPAVIWLTNSNLSLGCSGNGVNLLNGNTVSLENTVIQGYNQFGVSVGTQRGGYGRSIIKNLYEEIGSCTNPIVPQIGGNPVAVTAGVMASGRPVTYEGGAGPQGTFWNYGGGGGTIYYYYAVAHDATAATYSAPLYIGSGATGNSTLIYWPRVSNIVSGTPDTIAYDILRSTSNIDAPTTTACVGGSTTACGSVATSVSQCSGLFCSFTDNGSASTTAYTVNPTAFFPVAWFWPGQFVINNASNATNSTWPLTVLGQVEEGLENTTCMAGATFPSIWIMEQPTAGSNRGCWIESFDADTSNSGNQAATLWWDQSTIAGLTGKYVDYRPSGQTVPQGEIWTLVASNPTSLIADWQKKTPYLGTDMFIGNDIANASLTTTRMALGSPGGVALYAGNPPNGLYTDLFGPSQAIFKQPAVFTAPMTALAQCNGCSPFTSTPVTDPLSVNGSLSSNWTVTIGTWAISGGSAGYTLSGSPALALAVYTGTTFANNQYACDTVTTVKPYVGIILRGSNSAVTGYVMAGGLNSLGNYAFIDKFVGGSGTETSGPFGVGFSTGDVVCLNIVGNTMTATDNGVVIGTWTDTSSPIASGYPGIAAIDTAGGALNNFVGGSLTATTNYAVTFNSGLTLAGVLVAALPSASANPGTIMYVTDSTTISAEGQTCVGSSGNGAYAMSNGVNWKCF